MFTWKLKFVIGRGRNEYWKVDHLCNNNDHNENVDSVSMRMIVTVLWMTILNLTNILFVVQFVISILMTILNLVCATDDS